MSANVIAMFDAALAAAVIRANPDLLQRGHIKQTEILKDLFEGHYESATTVAQAFEGALLGIGVAEAVDGEIVAFDNTVWRVPVDGNPVVADPALGLPFSVVAVGGTEKTEAVAEGTDFTCLTALIDEVLKAAGRHHEHCVAAVRVDGTFTGVVLRSEPRQQRPYRPLTEVLEHEVQFPFATWAGTLVGFRFPDVNDQVVIPGLHLHGIGADRQSGGHCHRAITVAATLRVWIDDVDIFVPMTGVHYGM
ncbi:alpha-acetolactate decarboxylase [Actinomycetes bacterium]|nr:alpha-acetolactate decarboxylase [Actinomycetes bacterium]